MTKRLSELQENLDDLRKQRASLNLASSHLETEIIGLKLQIEVEVRRIQQLKAMYQSDEQKDSFDDDDF